MKLLAEWPDDMTDIPDIVTPTEWVGKILKNTHNIKERKYKLWELKNWRTRGG